MTQNEKKTTFTKQSHALFWHCSMYCFAVILKNNEFAKQYVNVRIRFFFLIHNSFDNFVKNRFEFSTFKRLYTHYSFM